MWKSICHQCHGIISKQTLKEAGNSCWHCSNLKECRRVECPHCQATIVKKDIKNVFMLWRENAR